jgi:hypothetical protein
MSMVDSNDEEKLVPGRVKSKSMVDSEGKEELVKGKGKRNVVTLNDDSGTNMELPDLGTDPGAGGEGDLQLLKLALLFSLFMTTVVTGSGGGGGAWEGV